MSMGEGDFLAYLHGLDREMVEIDIKISKYYPTPSLTHVLKKGIIKTVA